MGVTDWGKDWLKRNVAEWGGLANRFTEDANINSQGFNNRIKWKMSYNDSLKDAKDTNRPLMLVIHTENCRSSRSFREWFSRASGIIELSQYFTMVALTPDKLPKNSQIFEDGMYVPQVVFLKPTGELIPQGELNAPKGFKHFFPGTTPLLDAMKAVRRASRPA